MLYCWIKWLLFTTSIHLYFKKTINYLIKTENQNLLEATPSYEPAAQEGF